LLTARRVSHGSLDADKADADKTARHPDLDCVTLYYADESLMVDVSAAGGWRTAGRNALPMQRYNR
jgi:hypothetical protein